MIIRLFGNLIVFIGRKEVSLMVPIYVALIMKGKRKFSEVPEPLKAKVKEMLIDLELEDLIKE